MPQALCQDHLIVRVSMAWAASNTRCAAASPHFEMRPFDLAPLVPAWRQPRDSTDYLGSLWNRAGTWTVARKVTYSGPNTDQGSTSRCLGGSMIWTR